MGLPVPPGFTITTEACLVFLAQGGAPPEMLEEAGEHLATLQAAMGRELGDPTIRSSSACAAAPSSRCRG